MLIRDARPLVSTRKFISAHARTRKGLPPLPTAAATWPLKGFQFLHRLGSPTKQSFHASTLIRSNSFSDVQVYALYRQTNILEEPHKTKAGSLLVAALNFRKLPIPPAVRPLLVRPLAHSSFLSEVKTALRTIIKNHEESFPPLHVPPPATILISNPTVASATHSW